jgi:hypothetical protein
VELSNLSLNMALGNAVVTVASISMGSDLAIQHFSANFHCRTGDKHPGLLYPDVIGRAAIVQAARANQATKVERFAAARPLGKRGCGLQPQNLSP